jgi:hypothetical protein
MERRYPAVHSHGRQDAEVGTIASRSSKEPLDFVIAAKVDRVSINDYEDLLAEVKQ